MGHGKNLTEREAIGSRCSLYVPQVVKEHTKRGAGLLLSHAEENMSGKQKIHRTLLGGCMSRNRKQLESKQLRLKDAVPLNMNL
jgi:hypothetical protein